MPLLQETTHPKNQIDSQTSGSQSGGLDNQISPPPETKSKLLTMIGQWLPFAPLVFEQFTGQKVPAMTGTLAEMQTVLLQISTNLQVVVQNQQQLAHRLNALENSAVQQLTTLTQQFNSLRLTHTQEKKQIEFNPPLEN